MKRTLLYIMFLTSLNGCKKLVEVPNPNNQLTETTVFSTDATATAAQLAIYSLMETDGFAYYMIVNAGLSSDEFSNFSNYQDNIDLIDNNLTANNASAFAIWSQLYRYIYQANQVIEGVSNSTTLSAAAHDQLIGEAKFTRAFCHYYLVHLFGDIPLVTTTDFRTNSVLPRTKVAEIYSFIKQDLDEAIGLLSIDYLDGSGHATDARVRPNKMAAVALLARLQLDLQDWTGAANAASEIISKSDTYELVQDLNSVFLLDSKEAIWQIMAVLPQMNTFAGAQLILLTTPSSTAYDTNFLKSFESGDLRADSWINSINVDGNDYYYPFKYKVGQNVGAISEYTMVFRLSEQYLIRAEARARLGDLEGAQADINSIRNRAGLVSLSGLNETALLKAIQDERRHELFSEFGDRWFDIIRTGSAENIISNAKASGWSDMDALYPIPQTERLRDPFLTQNPGY